MPGRLLGFAMLMIAAPAFGQGVDQKIPSGGRNTEPFPAQRTAVPTQPSNNPFVNPIGQGVPPAVSTTRRYYNRRTHVPLR